MDIKELDSLYARYVNGETELFDVLVKEYSKLVENNPENTKYVHRYGHLHEQLGRRYLSQAEKIYEKVLFKPRDKNDSNYFRIDGQLMTLRNSMGKNKYSIELYKKRVLEFPEESEEYVFLALAYLNADQVQEAKKVMEAAQKITTDGSMNYYYVLGEMHARLGDNEKALDNWNKSVEIPYSLGGWFSRAFMFKNLGRLEEAAEEWRKIIKTLEEYHEPIDCVWPKEELAQIEKELNK